MNWRQVIAVIVLALITHLCLVYGLIVILPLWLGAPLVGGITALAAQTDWPATALGTLAGLGVGVTLAQPAFLDSTLSQMQLTLMFVFLGALAAGASAFVLGLSAGREQLEQKLAFLLIAVILALLWTTTLQYNQGVFTPGEPTVNAWLSAMPQLGQTPTDRDLYLRLFYDTHAGVPYYDAYARVYQSDPLGEFRLPNGVPGYRLPTLFLLWQTLPADGAVLPLFFLVFASLAVCSAYAIGAQLAPPRLAVLGALMVAAAYLTISTSSFVVFVDGWAMALTLAGLALLVASQRKHSRPLLWAAVAVMLLAASLREILLYPMLLAGASALLLPKEKWAKELWPWLLGFAIFCVIYAAHTAAIGGRVDKSGSVGFWLNGGVGHLVATQRFFEQLFGGAPLFVPLMVVAGLVGAVMTFRVQVRLGVFLTACVLIPHITFLFFGSAGRDMVTGAVPGYWAMLVVPIALAMAPVALAPLVGFEKKDSMNPILNKG